MVVKITQTMVSQTVIKALNIEDPGLSDEQVEQIKAIITKNTHSRVQARRQAIFSSA